MNSCSESLDLTQQNPVLKEASEILQYLLLPFPMPEVSSCPPISPRHTLYPTQMPQVLGYMQYIHKHPFPLACIWVWQMEGKKQQKEVIYFSGSLSF